MPAMPHAAAPTEPDILIVASSRRWVADDFASAGLSTPVRHDAGMFVPVLTGIERPAWWTPTEHAARLMRAGVVMPLVSPGPYWLSRVPEDLLGRSVWTGPLVNIRHAIQPISRGGWCKIAEAKVPDLDAKWWDRIEDFRDAAHGFGSSEHAIGLPEESVVQVTQTHLDIESEHRSFVRRTADGWTFASSWYLTNDPVTGETGIWDPDLGGTSNDPAPFVNTVIDAMGDDQPPAYVLDVAKLTSGRWVVLEANPAWSAATYGCDMVEVMKTVLAAVDYAGQWPQWAWRPDPWITARVERMTVLPSRL